MFKGRPSLSMFPTRYRYFMVIYFMVIQFVDSTLLPCPFSLKGHSVNASSHAPLHTPQSIRFGPSTAPFALFNTNSLSTPFTCIPVLVVIRRQLRRIIQQPIVTCNGR